jgi:sec-independent protein translocase protein TatA
MPNIGIWEIAIVLFIALIIFGPKRLPELGRSLGKGIREFKGSISGEHDDEPDTAQRSEIAAPPTAPPDAKTEDETPVHDRG